MSAQTLKSIAQPIDGVHLIERRSVADERGSFCRFFCRETLAEFGISAAVSQANLSRSHAEGTFRGLHYQIGPAAETKIVSCVAGSVIDLVLDLRPNSKTLGKLADFTLSAGNNRAVVVPEGCAHGFLTMEPESALLYFVTANYDPTLERGVRWNDPAIHYSWPQQPVIISNRDRQHPDLNLATALS